MNNLTQIKVVKAADFSTTLWSGGTTTELFIHPPASSYKNRDFQFRLSSATIETATSSFTSLPGISRQLMILDGEAFIKHEGHHECILHKFDLDCFDGAWTTISEGKCRDFNLMMRGEMKGNIKAEVLDPYELKSYAINLPLDWMFFYVNTGRLKLEINQSEINLYSGDLGIISNLTAQKIQLQGEVYSEVILVEIINAM